MVQGWRAYGMCALWAGLAAPVLADTTVLVGAGEVLGLGDLLAGLFMGQEFVLESGTVFLVRDGGVFGPVPDVDFTSLGFGGAKVVLSNGGVFASGPGSAASRVSQAEVEVFPGGMVESGFAMGGGSKLLVDGGVVGDGLTLVTTEVRLRSGSIGSGVFALRNVQIFLEGGTIDGLAAAFRNAQYNISAGVVRAKLSMHEESTLALSGGRIGDQLVVSGNASAFWSGGVIVDSIHVESGATVAILGAEFELDGESAPAVLGSFEGDRVLTGVLADGTPFILSPHAGDSIRAGGMVLVNASVVPPDFQTVIVDSGVGPEGARPGQRVILDGGSLPSGFAAVGADIEIRDGVTGRRFETSGSRVVITGGAIGDSSRVLGNSIVEVHGGTVGGACVVAAGGRMHVAGGMVSYFLSVNSGGEVHLESGEISYLPQVLGGGRLRVSGGVLGENLRVFSGGTLQLDVSHAELDGVPVQLEVGQPVVLSERGGAVLRVVFADGSVRELLLSETFSFTHDFFEPGSILSLTRVAACAADFAEPFGELNASDVMEFMALFNAQSPLADLAPPFGVWNFFDVSAYMALYNEGCP